MQKQIISLLVGLVFGLGLIVSGMTNPAKVVGFLDLFGAWDPSLALVMGGAIGVGVVFFRLAGQRTQAVLGGPMHLPTRRDVDRRLVVGGVLFGAGWGLAGYCPGPMITSLSFANSDIITVVGAYIVGTLIARTLLRAWERDQLTEKQRAESSCID